MLEPAVGLEAAVVDEEQVAAGQASGLHPGSDLEAGPWGEVGRGFAGGFGEGHVRERTQPFDEAVAVDIDVDLLDAADLGHLEDVHGKAVEYLVGEHATTTGGPERLVDHSADPAAGPRRRRCQSRTRSKRSMNNPIRSRRPCLSDLATVAFC